MIHWIETEDGSLLNLAQVTKIEINKTWRTYTILLDNTILERFTNLEDAKKAMIKLKEVLYQKGDIGEYSKDNQ